MDFKRNQFKIKDKHDFDIPNHPPHSHLQKRLEAFLKTSPFKMSSAQSLVKQSNVLKFIKSLNPILTARKSLKFSIFQALKHHMLTTSHYKKGMANRKFDLIKQMKEMIGIIQFVKEKPCSIIRSKFNKPKNKMIKFAEILMKINDKNELYKEKTRHFFHRWRLISFESSLRKISAYHGEIIQKQVIDQFSNLFLSVVRRFIKPSFDKIVSYTKRKNQSLWSSKSFRPKLQREAFSLCILLNFMKEKIKYSIFLGFGKLRQNIDGKNGFPLKDDKKRISKGKMLFFVMKNIFKARLLIFFQKLQSKKQFFSVPIPIPPENLSINLLQIFKLIKYKEDFQKQYAFSTIIEYNDSLQIFKKTKKTFLQKLFLSMKVKILSEVLKKWSIISIKTKDPIITTKQKHSNIEKPSENPENMKINRWIMINQAMVNKELESQQKKKTSKLLNLNKELGLIEISVLFARKQKLFTRIFFNNFKILGTFEPKRYQEFEHYLKILQEEKEILHDEFEEIENYNKKFSKHIDQKMTSIWAVSSIGALAVTDEKSGQEGLVDHNSLFNEENEEVRIGINYLEFLESKNVELREEELKNEQKIKHDEEKYETELNILKEKIRNLQMNGSSIHFQTKQKKFKLPDKKFSMIRAFNSHINKKSFSHDHDESD